jgi:hypothetical protein
MTSLTAPLEPFRVLLPPPAFWAKKPQLAIAASGKTHSVIAGPLRGLFSAISINVMPMTGDRDAGRALPDQPAAGRVLPLSPILAVLGSQ